MAYDCSTTEMAELLELGLLENWEKRRDPLCIELTRGLITEARLEAFKKIGHDAYKLTDEQVVEDYLDNQ